MDGGQGNDTIYSNNAGNMIVYEAGNGRDVIDGFGENDSIYVGDSEVTSVTNGDNRVITINRSTSNQITLIGGAELDLIVEDGIIHYAGRRKLTLSEKADTLIHEVDDYDIDALAGADNIENTGARVSISGGAGVDTIKTSGNDTTINGGAGGDKIYIEEAENVILEYSATDGKDTVWGFNTDDSIQFSGNLTSSVTSGSNKVFYFGSSSNAITVVDGADFDWDVEDNIIYATEPDPVVTLTDKADTYINEKSGVAIDALAGNDKLTNSGAEVSISAGDGNDTIITSSAETTIYGGAGADRISLTSAAENTIIEYESGDGKDTIYGFDADDSIKIVSGNVNSIVSGSNVTFQVNNSSNFITIIDGADKEWAFEDDTIFIDARPVINLTDRADTYNNIQNRADINALAGNDKITNSGLEVSISAGAGNDTITNTGAEVTIDAGAGNDVINSDDDEVYNAIIIGGKGNDTIYTNGNSNVIQYANGDGKDVIFGFGGDDTVEVNGNIGTGKQSGDDVVFNVNNSTSNTITFKNTKVANLVVESNDDTAKWEIAFVDSSADILDDDNFMSFEAQIADVSEITDTNYSVTNLDAEQNYNNLAQDDAAAKALTYGDKK